MRKIVLCAGSGGCSPETNGCIGRVGQQERGSALFDGSRAAHVVEVVVVMTMRVNLAPAKPRLSM